MKARIYHFILLTLLTGLVQNVSAQGTAFTYQGRLFNGTNAVNGLFDLRFIIFDAASGGSQTAPLTNSPTGVTNGLFTVSLDFGNQFPGASRWLEVAVRPNGGTTFTNLSPRQKINPTPYAIFAGNAGTATTATSASSVAAANITGTILVTQLPATVVTNGANGVNFSGSFNGNGGNLTNLSLSAVNARGILSWPGGFNAATAVEIGNYHVSVTTADVNGDGRPDVICTSASTTLLVFTNGNNGLVQSASISMSGSLGTSVTAALVNNDNKPDLICATQAGFLVVLTNNGTGGFTQSSLPAVTGPAYNVVSADVNGDGKADLISANGGSTLTVLTNNGSGGFATSSSPGVVGFTSDLATADVNGDGKADLFCPNNGFSSQILLTNNGSGGFVLAASPFAPGGIGDVAMADVNGDGKVDLLGTFNASLVVWTNVGSSIFGQVPSYPSLGDGFSFTITAADVNGDGRPDVIGAGSGGYTLTVLTNNGSGYFATASTPTVSDSPYSVATADLNGDGRVDLVSGNAGSLQVLLNTPTIAGQFTGDGSGLTALNAANLAGALSATNLVDSIPPAVLTSVPAENLTGTVPDARLSTNVAILNRTGQTFTGSNVFTRPLVVDNNVKINDDLTATGVTQFGSGTGTATGPDKGIITRRAYSIDTFDGSIVARTDDLMLVRDGSNAGFKIINGVFPGSSTIAFTGLTAAGTNVNAVIFLSNPSTPGTNVIFSNAQNVISFRGTFGDTFNADHLTEVSLTRFLGDFYWTGTITSTYNQ